MEGSLLFWALLLTTFITIALFQNRDRNRALMPWVTATSCTVAAFFLSMLVFITPPFALLPFVPAEGTDLNPLLQNYWMQIHPPSLYLGYVSWTIPFGFAVAALVTGRLDDLWIRTSRRWCLMAWFFLSLGNLFGARWAYEVLGWGGYWAWDPVENAAFMPWLTGTAYLHSVMIQERKDMLKVWNMTLIIVTFSLTIFGTFLTRSGVISSVHSFTQSGLGPYFMAFLAFLVGGSTALTVWRLDMLRPRHKLDSLLSRESAFLFNNLLLVGIAFATLWGTIFPVLSEWVRGVKITVGPPFFNRVNAPLAIALLLLMGVGPPPARHLPGPRGLRRGGRRARRRRGGSQPFGCAGALVLGLRDLHGGVRVPPRGAGAHGHGRRVLRRRAGRPASQEPAPLRRLRDPRGRGLHVPRGHHVVGVPRGRAPHREARR
jgi:cytochrome c-type biogenesis protein CcmF